jgi:hypothetical protein
MTGRFSFNLKRLFGGYFTIFGFAAGTAGMVLAHGGSILNYAYPLLATVLALFLFAMQRNIYLSFVWLIYLFTPLVRRLVDFHTLYHKVSPVMFTPLLVTLIAFIPLLRNPRFMLQRNLSDFLLILVVFIYGLAVGLALNSLAATVYDFLNFFVPFGFGLAFMADSSGYLRNRASFLSTVMFGLLLISIYGIYQFRNMPPWDAYWLRQSGFGSAGPAIANQIRLFGPSNSPENTCGRGRVSRLRLEFGPVGVDRLGGGRCFSGDDPRRKGACPAHPAWHRGCCDRLSAGDRGADRGPAEQTLCDLP